MPLWSAEAGLIIRSLELCVVKFLQIFCRSVERIECGDQPLDGQLYARAEVGYLAVAERSVQ